MSDPASNPIGLDAYKPGEVAQLVEKANASKAQLGLLPLFTLGALAGAFIALGAMFYTLVMIGAGDWYGLSRLLGGAAFSLGLILVIVGGAELFTGNALIVMAWVSRHVSTAALLRNWVVVYVANFFGALIMVGLVILAQTHDLGGGAMGRKAAEIAEAKFALSPMAAFARGILCNVLVCLAVWLTFASRTVGGKILAIFWPITAFVALGFEHSIANMYLLFAGIAAGADGGVWEVAANLVPVSLGNVVGGVGGVALSYWAVYIRPAQMSAGSDA